MVDLIALDNDAKVWIYQSDEEIPDRIIDQLKPVLYTFIDNWTSHNQALKAYGNIFHNRFLVLFVDETQSMASGCSIDKSVHFVEKLGEHIGVNFFDRLLFSYLKDDEIHIIRMDEFPKAYAEGIIDDSTQMFDNLVKTKGQFIDSWVKPLKDSWHKQFV